MPGRVCNRHERYVRDGELCPYCKPLPEPAEPIHLHVCDYVLPPSIARELHVNATQRSEDFRAFWRSERRLTQQLDHRDALWAVCEFLRWGALEPAAYGENSLARTVSKCRCGTYEFVSPDIAWFDRASGRMHSATSCPG